MATAWTGVTAVLVAPLAATLSARLDPRKLVFAGIFWLGAITLWRTHATTDMTNWNISLPLLVMGLGMPFFFIPLTGLALASVKEEETASAAGLMNFLRTLSGAFATSLVNTAWEGRTTTNHAELAGLADAAKLGDAGRYCERDHRPVGDQSKRDAGHQRNHDDGRNRLLHCRIHHLAGAETYTGGRRHGSGALVNKGHPFRITVSTAATGAQAAYGKVATNPVRFRQKPT